MEKVGIFLSTYNGEKYLKQQIDSILSQKGVDTTLFIRDDGSSDGTHDIIHEYIQRHENIIEIKNENNINFGVTKSFFSILQSVLKNDDYKNIEFFSFADQDDVWFENKLRRAVSLIKGHESSRVLYFSKKRIVDSQLNYLRDDKIRFHNDIWDFFDRSNAFGCTMVMNRRFSELFVNIVPEEIRFILHDAFVFRTAICIKAMTIYDPVETILYRQHGTNVAGSPKNFSVFQGRIRRIFSLRDHYAQKTAKEIDKKFFALIPQQNIKILRLTEDYDRNLSSKILLLKLYAKNKREIKDKIMFAFKLFTNLI